MLDSVMSLGERTFFSEPSCRPERKGLISLESSRRPVLQGRREVPADAVFLSHAQLTFNVCILLTVGYRLLWRDRRNDSGLCRSFLGLRERT